MAKQAILYLVVGGALALGCGDSESSAVDAGPDYPQWSMGQPNAAEAMGTVRSLTHARGIIHLHSPLSHDACDGKGIDENDVVNEPCLQDLRAALCTTRVDFAALTDHDDHMADRDFVGTYLQREGDELITDAAGDAIASRVQCSNGHSFMWTVGGENSLMPIMLNKHPDGTVEERKDVYNAAESTTAGLFRDLGGLTLIAHTESKQVDDLRAYNLDGLEIYNLHANLDPTIRAEDLGLNGPQGIRDAIKFGELDELGPEPDLAFLGFFQPSDVALGKWDTLLGEGLRLTGTAGTDAHQNVLPILFRDEERGDSYRRMIRWFSNVALVSDAADPIAIQDALDAGRSFVAFEIMGTPANFDVRAMSGGKPTLELGAEVLSTDGYSIEVVTPSVYGLDSLLPKPEIRVSILHVDATGTREVAGGSDGMVSAQLSAPGAYRVEVYITPKHLTPYLGNFGPELAEREYTWIYSNPIYVTAPLP